MVSNVRRNKWAQRNHRELMLASILQCSVRQLIPDTVAFQSRRHFCMQKDDTVSFSFIEKRRDLPIEFRLVELLIFVVLDLDMLVICTHFSPLSHVGIARGKPPLLLFMEQFYHKLMRYNIPRSGQNSTSCCRAKCNNGG